MNTTDTKINIRIDRKTKDAAKETLEALGLDLSSGVKLFLRSVINTQSIPFEVRTKNGYTLQQEKEMLDSAKEAKDDLAAGRIKTYKSVNKLMESLDE